MARVGMWLCTASSRLEVDVNLLPAFRGLKILLVVVWLAALVVFIQRVFIPAAKTVTYGFMGYYTASWLLAHGQWTPEFYDDVRFTPQVEALSGGKIGDIISYNPPAVALILLPLVGLSPENARWIWTLTNGVLLALACGIMFRTLGGTFYFWEMISTLSGAARVLRLHAEKTPHAAQDARRVVEGGGLNLLHHPCITKKACLTRFPAS